MKKLVVSLSIFCSSCWAPRCPIDTCSVRLEHRHSSLVSGTFSGKDRLYMPTMHFLWDKKSQNAVDTEFVPGGKTKRQKSRSKFPWERW